jgi:FemAB-related protein (PEP-CTERM system-associated)
MQAVEQVGKSTHWGGSSLTTGGGGRKRQNAPTNLPEAEVWNRAVAGCDHAKFYHLYEWGTLLKRVHGHEIVYLREDRGVFPLACIKSPIFGKRLISLPFADYGGPCAPDESTADRLIAGCEEAAQGLDVDFIEIRSPDSRYFDALERHGFVRRDDYVTFIVRLDGRIEDIWKGIGDKTRNRVRKAEKSGVQITEASTESDLRVFFLLYQNTMKRLGSPPQPYEFFEGIWDSFHPDEMTMPLAMWDGECIAAGLYFLHGNTIHGAYGASNHEYGRLAANTLLEWHVINLGHERGFSHLDFGRTRRDDQGIVRFKKRWGGELVTMPYFYRFYKKTLDERQEIKYRWASRLWSSYMPRPLANRIGPSVIKHVG